MSSMSAGHLASPAVPSADAADEALVAAVRHALAAGQPEQAVARILEAYGEVLRATLTGMAGERALALEAWSRFGEDLVRGLADFRWQCPLRSWLWILARNALRRELKAQGRLRARHLPEDAAGEGARQALQAGRAHTETRPWQRTTLRDWVTRARAELAPDDALLLVLRVDQGMAWLEIARVLEELPEAAGDDARLRRRSAALRKRYGRVVERLRRAAHAEGLL